MFDIGMNTMAGTRIDRCTLGQNRLSLLHDADDSASAPAQRDVITFGRPAPVFPEVLGR